MKYLDLTLPTPQENLALDEALIEWCEEGLGTEVLRFWESPNYFVVLGYSNKIHTEVKLASCKAAGLPILRRSSGGGTVLQGPGCLNYSLLARIPPQGPFASIRSTTRYILERHREALAPLVTGIEVQGTSDLTVGNRKFSGNAQRRKRHFFLFHGTFLLNFDFTRMEKFLAIPAEQPAYRQNRSHTDFLINLPASGHAVKERLRKTWGAQDPLTDFPLARLKGLASLGCQEPLASTGARRSGTQRKAARLAATKTNKAPTAIL